MKKIFLLFFAALFLFTSSFAQNMDQLYGIWEGKDRFVFIEPVTGENGAVVELPRHHPAERCHRLSFRRQPCEGSGALQAG